MTFQNLRKILMSGSSFLGKQEALQLGSEEVNFTCICLGNLTLPSHDDDNSEDSIRGYIQEGYYGLSDYSVAYWQEHVRKIICGKALDSEELFRAFNTAVRQFLSRRFTPSTKTASRCAISSLDLSRFKDEAFYPHLVQAMAHKHNERGSLSDPSQDRRFVVPQLLKVREIMEHMVLEADPSSKERFHMLYGQNLFRCPELRCKFFHEGFSIVIERDTHRNKHRRAFVCTYPGCPSALIGFTTSTELDKHNLKYHGATVYEDSFPWNGNAASIDINKQIKNGNLSEVQAWADQWEAKIPVERLWFWTARDEFDGSPLGLAIHFEKADIFEALLSQASDDLFKQETITFSPQLELFEAVIRDGSKEIAYAYLRKLDRIDASLFEVVLSLDPKENVIASFLSLVATKGDKRFKDNILPYLKVAVEKEHEASTRYILLDIGLWEELHRGPWSSDLDDLGCNGHFKFLCKILPELGDSSLMINSRLHRACQESDSSEVANLLQDEHANPNQPDKSGYTPLLMAVWENQIEIVQKLVEDPRILLDGHVDQGRSHLHWAILESKAPIIDILLYAGIPVEELTRPVWMDGFQTTAIEHSKGLIHSHLRDYLNNNTNWSLYPEDSTMLIRSCAAGNLRMAQNIICRAPQDLNTPDSRGVTPFLQAVKCGQHDIAQFLLGSGCDSQAFEGPDQMSPLMVAVKRDDLDMVRLLLSKARVDPTYKNKKGETALDYLEPNSPMADQIREEIEDAVSLASVFGNIYR